MKPARLTLPVLLCFALFQHVSAASPTDVSRALEPDKKLDDPRLGPQRTLSDKYHPWTPAATKVEWEKQAQAIRERVLVATGLWPMPPKEPLKPVIHGRIDRGDYTVEKVFFASLPGHYVSGNLYRPAKIKGKVPGVLCPHGHWKDGRFYDAGEKEARSQLSQGAEETLAGARYPLQARMVQLARLGCVVFHYDMVGVADSQPIGHGAGFADAEAELRLQSALGLQTFNSIRALDFVSSLPDVDPKRIAVNGASGGGTQTFLLCAIDPRPAVAFPAVMVSTNMQGGCVCENSDLLRIGINNVAIAALFAPKPLGMSGANDWTVDIETKGLPELKQVYAMYGRADDVRAKCFRQFGHNYNRVSREMMYDWFNAHLNLGHKSPIVEEDFWPIKPQDLSVFDEQHPRPADAMSAMELRAEMTATAKKQFAELLPKDKAGLDRYRDVVGTAARVMLDAGVPDSDVIDFGVTGREDLDGGVHLLKGIAARSDDNTRLPWVLLRQDTANGSVVLWIDGQGKSHLFGPDGKPTSQVRKLLDAGNAVVSVDLFQTGEFLEPNKPISPTKVSSKYAGYTFGYNSTLLANRVHDVLTAVAALKKNEQVQKIELVGTGDAGPCVLLAAALLRDKVASIMADARGLSYETIPATTDPLYLPGALKYGGLGGLAALAAPTKLEVFGTEGISSAELEPLSAVYKSAGGVVTTKSAPLIGELVVGRLGK
jgi:dienelactone hydrolase